MPNKTFPALNQAAAYVAAGLSVIPIRGDGSKAPAGGLLPNGKWSEFQSRRATTEELRCWFGDRGPANIGLAIIGGRVSGGLEILDIDNFDVAQKFLARLSTENRCLYFRLTMVKTPRPGLHLYYRCADAGGSQKLALIPDPDADATKPGPKTLIEIKGEGGYCIAPPSPGACHPTGRPYTPFGRVGMVQLPTISPASRDHLFRIAASFNEWVPLRPQFPAGRVHLRPIPTGNRPGDRYNATARWTDILCRHGWSPHSTNADGITYWTRPGKDDGTSATTNVGGTDLLYVFSSNAEPFEQDESYTKFAAYTVLNHAGDYNAAAQRLNECGYGGPRLRHQR